jgi:hypothetical protein
VGIHIVAASEEVIVKSLFFGAVHGLYRFSGELVAHAEPGTISNPVTHPYNTASHVQGSNASPVFTVLNTQRVPFGSVTPQEVYETRSRVASLAKG